MKPRFKILAGSGAVCFIFCTLNAGYLFAHLKHAVSPPTNISYALPPATIESATASTPLPVAPATTAPDRLTIESLGIDVPIIYIDQKNEKTYQAALKKGVVHFPGTALPGEPGNVYIFGHSSDYSWSKNPYRTVFALLTKIKIGEVIQISDGQGRIYYYRVTGTKIISPKDTSVLDQQDNKKKLLTLQTSYPLGTALRRFIVFAEMSE